MESTLKEGERKVASLNDGVNTKRRRKESYFTALILTIIYEKELYHVIEF